MDAELCGRALLGVILAVVFGRGFLYRENTEAGVVITLQRKADAFEVLVALRPSSFFTNLSNDWR